MKFRDANLQVDEKSSFTHPPSYTEAVVQGSYVKKVFFNKVAGLRLATLLKKRIWHWCFPVNFTKFL